MANISTGGIGGFLGRKWKRMRNTVILEMPEDTEKKQNVYYGREEIGVTGEKVKIHEAK